MADVLHINTNIDKAAKYALLLEECERLLLPQDGLISSLANCSAILKQSFGWFWVGFYLVSEGVLKLGPFQGELACTRIEKGRGVCGTAWKEKQSILVPDVDAFPGHIACSSASKSELVVPIIKDNEVVAVLDADATVYAAFDETDAKGLEQLCKYLSKFF